MRVIPVAVLAALFVMGAGQVARAQTAPATDDEWHVTVYPVLAWLPVSIGIGVDIPPIDGDAGGSGEIVDSRFDGAFFGGAAASNGIWRFEGYALWVAFGGDRLALPSLVVDLDVIYGSAKLGRRVAPDLYVTGGVRRVALDYDIALADLPRLSGKPGVWDPIVGIGWHRERRAIEWHATFEGGGFGVGADVDLAASFSVDWKPATHFGLTAGYNFLYLKVSGPVAGRDVTITPTAHGPSVGFGLYF